MSRLGCDADYNRDGKLWPGRDGGHGHDGIHVPNVRLFHFPLRVSWLGCDGWLQAGHDHSHGRDASRAFFRHAPRPSLPGHDHSHGHDDLKKFLGRILHGHFVWS